MGLLIEFFYDLLKIHYNDLFNESKPFREKITHHRHEIAYLICMHTQDPEQAVIFLYTLTNGFPATSYGLM